MNNFTNISYVGCSGIAAPVDPTHIDNPYFGQTRLAKKVFMDNMRIIRWKNSNGNIITLRFKSLMIAAVDKKSNLLVVAVHFSDPQYHRPTNSVVFREDGTLDHIITPPLFVEQVVKKLPDEDPVIATFPVEAISEILLKNQRILIGLNFNYEWIERRYYDPKTREWQERDQIYRQ